MLDSDPEFAFLGVSKCVLVRSPGFEPGIISLEGIDWIAFKDWLLKNNVSERWAKSLVSYARRYADCLCKHDLSRLRELTETQRPNVIKGLSALSKYLGVHEQFRQQLKGYGFKWCGKNVDQIVIDRLNKIKNPEEVFEWIRQAKSVRPDLTDFLDLMAITGLRLVEAVSCYNLIIGLAKDNKLNEYYNEQTSLLEHWKHKETFIRKSKKAFISFVPADLVKRISERDQLTSVDSV
jgi:uncharacterized protein YecT (DUF1311 family)